MITRRQALKLTSTTGAAALLFGCAQGSERQAAQGGTAEAKRLRVLATSDMHGMFVPWDYALDVEDSSGSVAKLATAVKDLRDQGTLLVDVGDTIQDNMADLFLMDEVHPMIVCMNALGYEFGATGNHEYNFGMDVVRKTIDSFSGTVLTGNVKDERGNPIADGYAIVEKGDVRVGLIGMVTPYITHWDEANLRGCTVGDPVEETRRIVDQIKGNVDVFIGVMHMGLDNEYDEPHTGVRDLAQACPEFDLIVAAHSYDERAKQYAREAIGTLEGGPLAPKNEFEAIPQAVLMDTALIDLINEVQLHYSGAKVSSTALSNVKANVEAGPIRRCDVSRIYKHQNTLYTLEMTGAQLKRYLEWSAGYYKTFRKGDLSPAFDPEVPLYNYDMFQGVNYTIDVSKEPGACIRDLSWPDGAPILDDEAFMLVTSNYRATSNLLVSGMIFEEGDAPKLLESDVRGDLGDIRAMIADYIHNVRGGRITPECNENWNVVGFNWDEGMHKRAVELVANGTLELKGDQKHLPSTAITEGDVRRVDGGGR